MEVAHNEFVETDGLAPQTFSDLAAQHQNIMDSDDSSVDTVDRAGIPLGESGGSQMLIDNQVVTLRHKKTEAEPAVVPPLRDSIPSQDLGDPAKFRPTGISTMRNGRRRMEDRHVILHDLAAHLPENLQHKINPEDHVSFYAVYDGHAGVKAAASAASNLHNKLVESTNYPQDINAAIQDAIVATDQIIIHDKLGACGTTVALAFIKDKSMHCAWVGDSECVLARNGNAIRLVDSHRPDRPDEKERIEDLGGYVSFWGTWRVNGTMAVSRAIGDESLKPYLSTECDITTVQLLPTDDFFILACDGLWDYLKREDAVQMVYSAISEPNFDSEKLPNLAEKLNLSSVEKGSSDNISTVIVLLRPIQDIIKDMENPIILENRLEGLISTSPLITNPDLIRKSLNPSEHLPAWGKESTSPTPESAQQVSITPMVTPKLENGNGGMFSPDPFSSFGGMLQPNQSMEQFGQTTIDDFRPSISPVIPDNSFDQVDGINSDSPVKVDSGFISPKKDNDMENEEVSELMAHAKIQRVDQLLQLYNTEDDSPTPDEEKSLEEILAERRGVQEEDMDGQDDSEDDDSDGKAEPVELEDTSSEDSDDFAKVVVRESYTEESGCLVPPTSTLPTSQDAEIVNLEDISPSPNAIPEVNETMEAGEALLTKENPPIHNNNEQLMDQNNDHVTAGDQLMDNDHLTSVDQITDQLSLLATKRSETEKGKPELDGNSDTIVLTDGDVQNNYRVNGDVGTDNGPESISFELTDTNQGFMLKTPSADQQSLTNFDPNQTPTETHDQNSDNQTSITPNIEGLKLSDSEPPKAKEESSEPSVTSSPALKERSPVQVTEEQPNVCVIEENDVSLSNDVDIEMAEGSNCNTSGLSIPSLNIIPSTPVRSLSPIQHTDGETLPNGEQDDNIVSETQQDVPEQELAETSSQKSGGDSEPSEVSSSLPSQASTHPANEDQATESEVKKDGQPGSKPGSPPKKAAAGKPVSSTVTKPKIKGVEAKTKPTSDAAKKPGTGTGTEKPATGRPGSGTAARTATASAKSTAATKSLAKVSARAPTTSKPSSTSDSKTTTTTTTTARTKPTSAVSTSRVAATAASKPSSAAASKTTTTKVTAPSKTGSGSTAASRVTSAGSSRVGSAKAAAAAKSDDIEAKGSKKPLTAAATKPGSGTTRTVRAPVATKTKTADGETPGSPTKSTTTTSRPSTKPGVPRVAGTTSASVRRTESMAKKDPVRKVDPAAKDRVTARMAAVPRPTSKPAPSASNKSDVNTTLSSRPLTSTEARKPSQAAMRIAAARAAAAKNSLPRKPKTGANKSQAESPSEENPSVTSPTNAPAIETPPTKAESAIAALEAVPTPNVKAAAENPEEKPADLVVEGQSLESSA